MATIYGDQDPLNLNDILHGTEGDDEVYGGEGDDSIITYGGTDTIYGGEGNDVLSAEGGSDYLEGGDGDDIINALYGSNEVHGGNGNDTITSYGIAYGDSGNDWIAGSGSLYGGDGQDTITSVSSSDTIYGGNGSDVLIADAGATFIFDSNFGHDRIQATGGTINFNFQRPDDLKIYNRGTTLILESSQGLLSIKNYFNDTDLTNSSIGSSYTITFQDSLGDPSDTLDAFAIAQNLLGGSSGDDIIQIKSDTTSSGTIVVNSGDGDDWIEITAETYNSSTIINRPAILDGGKGNDVYSLKNTEATLVFSRDSGRDLVTDINGENLTDITIQLSDIDGSIALSDVYAAYENGSFILRILDSNATIVIGSATVAGIISSSNDWSVSDGSSSVSVKDLILQIPEIVSGDLVLADSSYDGSTNTQGEKIISLGNGNLTSGSDNETFVGIAQSVTLQSGFGQDIFSRSSTSNIIFEQEISEFTFSRDDLDLKVSDGNGNEATFLGFFISAGTSGNTSLHFYDSTSNTSQALSWSTLSSQIASTSDNSNIYLTSNSDLSTPPDPLSEAEAQHFYADLGNNITINGGSGTNYIHLNESNKANVIHDTSLGGTDIVVSSFGANYPQSLTIKTDSLSNLKFEYVGPTGEFLISHVNGSSIKLSNPLDEIIIDDGSSPFILNDDEIIDLIEEGTANYYVKTGITEGDDEHSFLSPLSGTNDIIDIRFNSAAKQSDDFILDGNGGDDTYFGGASSDTFIYGGTGSILIKNPNLWNTFGYDTIDLTSAGISKSDFIENSVRSGDDLIYNDGAIIIEGFFNVRELSETYEFIGNSQYSEGLSENIESFLPHFLKIFSFSVYTSPLGEDSLYDAAHVIEALHLSDGILRYDEIAALFPEISQPTPDDDELYSAELGNYIDALAGNDTVYGDENDNTILGNDGDDTLYGEDGNDTLDGGSGTNTLVGGLGDDTYIVSNSSDTITENDGEGYDVVQASVDFTLTDHAEDLILTGTDNINGTGNSLDNFITGNEGNNVIDGGTGNDIMIGGLGDDTYYVDSLSDLIIEAESEGTDTVYVASDIGGDYYTPEGIENVIVLGNTAINVYGNALNNNLRGNEADNIIEGGEGDDWLEGRGGSDTLIGGLGDDIYVISSSADVIIENALEGNDGVGASFSYELGDNLERLGLIGNGNIDGTGNELDNWIQGNSGNNRLTGKDGIDTLIGLAGNDTYVLDVGDTNDIITEASSGGIDTVEVAFSYVLSNTDNLENITLTGSGNINATGNNAANVLTGNSGNNRLNGGTGNDTLIGGAGDDTYVLETSGDTITENSGGGNDTVEAGYNYTLSNANLENLTLIGGTGNFTGTGNSGNNILTGNSGNNTLTGGGGNDTLNGKAGTDTLIGGTGDDTYILETSGDSITENSGEGNDTVQAGYSYSLTNANLENLTLIGETGNFTGTGNSGNNILTGNNGNNTLTGNAGNDTLKGGVGADQLLGGVGNDTYVLNRNDGADAITENDSTSGNTDVAVFGESGGTINHDQLWFKMNGSNLEVTVIGTTDKFTINSWSAGSARQVESFVTSDGYHLTNAQVANLVSAMASFSPPPAGTSTLDPSTYSAVLTQISASWAA